MEPLTVGRSVLWSALFALICLSWQAREIVTAVTVMRGRQPAEGLSKRFELKGPEYILGGDVYILQDNHTDTCYLIVTVQGQTYTPPPQPCAE